MKREVIWTTTVFQAVAAGVTTANIPTALVSAVDWVRGGNFEKGAILKCIRGWYQVAYAGSSTSVAPSWYLVLFKSEANEDPTIQNWTTGATYGSEDILWTDGGHMALSAAVPAAATPWITQSNVPLSRQINVQTNRKLNSDDTIDFAFVTPSAAQDWTISGVFRSLIELP